MRFQAIFFPFKEQSCYTALLKSNAFKNGIFKIFILVTSVKVFFLLSLFLDN